MTRSTAAGREPASPAGPEGLVVQDATIRVGDRVRTYLEVRAASAPEGGPLLLVFHGSRQTGRKLRAFSGGTFDGLAARHGVRVVYLDGHKGHWNDARASVDVPARREGIDDVGFARAVVDRYADAGAADPGRVFLAGYSFGGQMVVRLLHEAPELAAGAAVLCATQPAPEDFTDAGRVRPLPVLLLHGTRDPLVPYEGGTASLWGLRPRGLGLSFAETAAYYARRNGIGTAPVTTGRRPAAGDRRRTSVEVTEYREAGKPPVRAVTVHNGGHTVPNLTAPAPRLMGRTHLGLDTGELLWEFFAQGADGDSPTPSA